MSKYTTLKLLFIVSLSCSAFAQFGSKTIVIFPGVPSGSCAQSQLGLDKANGYLYSCGSGNTWLLVGPSATAANPGGSANQIQYNVSGTGFGGFTMSGDCTLTVATGVIVCTKTNGTAFGTFATQNYAAPPAIGGTTPNTGAFSGLTLSSITGSAQCLHVNSSGVVSGTGSDCGSGGGSGFPITIGSTSIASGSTTTTIAGLTLTSPTFTTPALGTPASGVITSLTGTCTSCTANAAVNISTNGTANQVWGMNSGASAQGWQTFSGSGISGGTANYIPLFGSATTITGDSAMSDNGTTITSTEPIAISGTTHGMSMAAGTAVSGASGSVIYAVDATNGYAEVNENNTGLSRLCTAANGICASSLAFPETVSGTTTSGGVPYFSNSTTLSSSGAGTTNAPMLWGGAGTAPGTGHATDNGTVWAFTEGLSVAPTSTSQVSGIFNNPTSTSVDIADFKVNGTTEGSVGNTGIFTGLSFAANGSGAGYAYYAAGAENCVAAQPANSYCEEAPATIATAYHVIEPAAVGTVNQVLSIASVTGQAVTLGWANQTGGVSSITGDSTIFNNSASTGAVTLTKANAASGAFLGNNTNTSAAPAYVQLSAINPQTATYQVLAADFAAYKTITVASGSFTITLVASTGQPAAGQYINVINYGTGTVTIARSGQSINGANSSIVLSPGTSINSTGATIWSDGTNYFASVDEDNANSVLNNAVNTGTAAMTLDMSASTTAPSLKLPQVVGGTILAGTSTGALSTPITITNANSSNNNTSFALGVSASGSSTGQTVMNLNQATTGGDILDWGTGGSYSAGVLSGQTISGSILENGSIQTKGATAGFLAMSQGSTSSGVAPCNAATTICFQAPTSVTSQLRVLAGAPATGFPLYTNSSGTMTETISATSGTLSSGVGVLGTLAVNAVLASTVANAAGHFTNLQVVTSLGGTCSTVPIFNVFDGTTNTGSTVTATASTQTKGTGTSTAQTLTFAAGDVIGIYISTAGATCTLDQFIVSAQYSIP